MTDPTAVPAPLGDGSLAIVEQGAGPVARGVVGGQIGRMVAALTSNPDRDEAVHTARKAGKRARAAMRLVRDHVGRTAYRQENVVLRDTCRRLAPVRDGAVMVATLDRLRESYRHVLAADAFGATRAYLAARHAAARAQILDDRDEMAAIVVTLMTASRRFAAWDPSTSGDRRFAARRVGPGFEPIGRGLARTYRRGRKAMRASYSSGTTDAFHEWRKRAKYLRYQLEALAPLYPEMIAPQAAELDRLGELLGEEHDLAVLGDLVRDEPAATADERERTLLLVLAARARLELQWEARPIGHALYSEQPAAFVRRIHGYWAAAATSRPAPHH